MIFSFPIAQKYKNFTLMFLILSKIMKHTSSHIFLVHVQSIFIHCPQILKINLVVKLSKTKLDLKLYKSLAIVKSVL